MTDDGTVILPRDKTGMGVTVDRDRVEDLTVGRFDSDQIEKG